MSTHQVALGFEDGVTRFITCAEDQTVADASYRARINIPLDCRDGACGTCKALCESGEYDGGTYIEDALTADEAAAGLVLPCSMRPRSDLVLQIASTSAVAKTSAATYKATVTGLERLSPTTMSLKLETEERDHLAFLPGQYVNIDVPGTGESRSYSFSTATDDRSLGFLVKLTPGGVMSTWLSEQAAVGDTVTFTGPNGSFFLREADRPLLLIAGGTGLAPILSILRTMRASGSTRPAHLVYGVSTDDDLVELAELEELAAAMPALTWDHCVSDPATTAAHQGYVMGLLEPAHLHGGDVAVYLCGPPPMVEAVRGHFADQGVEPTGFYYEKFALSGTATPVEEAVDASVADEPLDDAEVLAPVPGRTATETDDEPVLAGLAGRAVAGQELFPARDLAGLRGGEPPDPAVVAATARTLAGQQTFPSRDVVALVEPVQRGDRAADRELVSAHVDRWKTTMRRAMDESGTAGRPHFTTPGRFAGKVVVVTGAAQGIGEAVARRIGAEDGQLVLVDRSDLVHELADELATTAPGALAVVADLEAYDGAVTVVEQALARFGRVDVLVNNVGGAINFKPFTEFTDIEISAEVQRSLMTTLFSCRAVLPSMVQRGRGVIVNVSSAATRGIHRIPYSAAKGGINAITASLALEYAEHGIRVVATAPGGTEAPPRRISRGTPVPQDEREQQWFQAHIDQTLSHSLMHRYGSLDEQAAAITFLASEEASYITGTVLPVAGGDLG